MSAIQASFIDACRCGLTQLDPKKGRTKALAPTTQVRPRKLLIFHGTPTPSTSFLPGLRHGEVRFECDGKQWSFGISIERRGPCNRKTRGASTFFTERTHGRGPGRSIIRQSPFHCREYPIRYKATKLKLARASDLPAWELRWLLPKRVFVAARFYSNVVYLSMWKSTPRTNHTNGSSTG